MPERYFVPKIAHMGTERLLLRPLQHTDLADIQRLMTPEVCAYIPEIPKGMSAKHWVEEKLSLPFPYLRHVITLANTGEIIGYCQMFDGLVNTTNSYYAIHLGYWFGEDFWNKGYCSELLCKLSHDFFEYNNWDQEVIALVYDGNDYSGKALEKAGFRRHPDKRNTGYGSANVYLYETEFFINNVKNNPNWRYDIPFTPE